MIATVLSYDDEANPAIASMLGASAALMISDIPFHNPVAGINVGRINGEFVVNPSPEEKEESDIDLILVAKEDAIVMVEAGANEVSESDMLDALDFGHKSVQELLKAQAQLAEAVGKAKQEVVLEKIPEKLVKQIAKEVEPGIKKALKIKTKMERYAALADAKAASIEKLVTEDGEITKAMVGEVSGDVKGASCASKS